MSILVVKGIWLLVPSVPSKTNGRSFVYSHQADSHQADIELGLRSFHSTPMGLEPVEHGEAIATSVTSANQAGEVEADHLPVSEQRPELQPTLPTAVEAETSLGPAMVSGGRIDGNELPKVHTENTQPALTDAERQEFHPAAIEYLPSQPV